MNKLPARSTLTALIACQVLWLAAMLYWWLVRLREFERDRYTTSFLTRCYRIRLGHAHWLRTLGTVGRMGYLENSRYPRAGVLHGIDSRSHPSWLIHLSLGHLKHPNGRIEKLINQDLVWSPRLAPAACGSSCQTYKRFGCQCQAPRKRAIMNSLENLTINRKFFQTAGHAGLILRNGWLGRPHDNLFALTYSQAIEEHLLLEFDESLVLTFTGYSHIEATARRLVISGFAVLDLQWTEFDSDRCHHDQFAYGQVELVVGDGEQ